MFLLIFIGLSMLFLVGIYLSTSKARYVSAGNVEETMPELPADKRLDVRTSFIDRNGKFIDYKKYFIGIAYGNSMSPKGISDGDVFLANEQEQPVVGDVFVLRTPKKEGRAAGRLKLREIIDVNSDVLLTTKTYGEQGQSSTSTHNISDCLGKVFYVSSSF